MTNLFNTFELGCCYQNNAGFQIHICGVVDTIMYGKCFMAEEGYSKEKLKNRNADTNNSEEPTAINQNGWSNFKPISMEQGAAVGWYKITKEEFTKNNFC